ncbi:MAG: ATP-grasp domain-containing protein [Muribaculum sp.]|nr:ATP-grasp domain-containing protein [Muribaculum sp.]
MSKYKKCDVIVTYCWNRVGYNILRSLTAQGLNVWAADTSKHNICSMSKFCAGSFTYPDPFTKEDEFITCLLEKVEELKPKMLLPTHDEGIVIARYKDKFPRWLIIPIETEQKLINLSNKKIATQLAEEAGVPIPKIYKSSAEANVYPVVFKSVIGNSAKDVFFPKSKSELDSLIEKYTGKETLIEEWIGGGDVCVDCVRYGDFFQASVYRALVTKTDGGGTTTQREIIEMPQLIEYARQFLDYVDYNGVCGLDFRVDSNHNRIAFIELNARFTGGLATPIAAGFDIPSILYHLAYEGSYSDYSEARIGTKTKWILGDVITFVGRALSLKFSNSEMKKVASFSGFDAFDDFRSDDKKAILGEMMYYLSKLIKNGKLNP